MPLLQAGLGSLSYFVIILCTGSLARFVLRVHNDEGEPLFSKIGFSAGLGLALTTAVCFLLVFIGKLFFPQFPLIAVQLFFVIVSLLISLLLLLVGVEKIRMNNGPTASDLAPLIPVSVLVLLLAFWAFNSSRLFQLSGPDFPYYLSETRNLSTIAIGTAPLTPLYLAADYQLGFMAGLSGGASPMVLKLGVAALCILLGLVIYDAAWRIFQSRTTAFVALCVYSFTGTIWFDFTVESQLYGNLYGIEASVFFISCLSFLRNVNRARKPIFILLAIGMSNLLLSHYSAVSIFPALVAAALPAMGSQKILRRWTLLFTVIPGLFLFLDRSILYSLVHVLFLSGGSILGYSSLDRLMLQISPSLGDMMSALGFDLFSVIWLLLSVIGIGFVIKRRKLDILTFSLILWFLFLMVPFHAPVAWRFGLEAIAPTSFLVSYALSEMFRKLGSIREAVVHHDWVLPSFVSFLLFALSPAVLSLLIAFH